MMCKSEKLMNAEKTWKKRDKSEEKTHPAIKI